MNKLSAQPNKDGNWDSTPFFLDNFNTPRSNWDYRWFDYPNDNKWRAHLITGVTHDTCEHQVYQRGNAIFDTINSIMVLKANYIGGPMGCSDFETPGSYGCDTTNMKLYYYSGAITMLDSLRYGYIEACCKLPTKKGAFPGFWLWDNTGNEYRELDIFEVSWELNTKDGIADSNRLFTGGIYFHHNNDLGIHYGDHHTLIAQGQPGIEAWHKYAAEWTPNHCVWYLDDNAIGEYYGDSIPKRKMYVMLNYALDNWVLAGSPKVPIQSGFPDSMKVDYVKISKLKCDCGTNAIIQNNTQFGAFVYQVKKTITIGGYGYGISLSSFYKGALRATDGITINGDFTVPIGAELELITHPCPN